MNLLEVFKLNDSNFSLYNWIYEYNASTNDYMDNVDNISYIKEWLVNKSNHKKGLIITGPVGSGKSSLCIMSCFETKTRFYLRDSANKRSKKDLILFYQQIKRFKNSVLIMDDMDIIGSGEIIPISEIQKWLIHDGISIILIISDIYLKKIKDIIKYCDVVNIRYPKLNQFITKCKQINPKLSNQYIKKLVTHFNYEPRSILKNINSYFNLHILQQIEHEYDMYDSYNQMYQNKNINEKIQIFSKENGTIPIILQENYIDFKLSDNTLCMLSYYMAQADIFHKQTFNSNLSINNDIYAIMSTLLPLEYIKYNERKSISSTTKPRFGLIWTKQSAMYQKKKFINNIEYNLTSRPTLDIDEIYNIQKNIEASLENNDNKNILDIIQQYNLDKHSLISLFNLFNTNNDKKKLKNFIKTENIT